MLILTLKLFLFQMLHLFYQSTLGDRFRCLVRFGRQLRRMWWSGWNQISRFQFTLKLANVFRTSVLSLKVFYKNKISTQQCVLVVVSMIDRCINHWFVCFLFWTQRWQNITRTWQKLLCRKSDKQVIVVSMQMHPRTTINLKFKTVLGLSKITTCAMPLLI